MTAMNYLKRVLAWGGLSLLFGAPTIAAEFAALAIDKGNGSAYGWSYGQASLANAEQFAQQECSKRNGKRCTVVLAWSGEGCGVYKTVDKKSGTAYGWGIAKTQNQADVIANRELLKRSKGAAASNFVWACNAADKSKLKVIKNLNTDVKTTTIGAQVWMAENLSTGQFRNGDPIPLPKSGEEWSSAKRNNQPMSRFLKDQPANEKKYGRYYNYSAAFDKRGICPEGFHLPSKKEWETLLQTVGGTPKEVAAKLKSKQGWAKKSGTGTDQVGFSALPAGTVQYGDSFSGVGEHANFWTSTSADSEYIWAAQFRGWGQDVAMDKVARDAAKGGLNIRCIQD